MEKTPTRRDQDAGIKLVMARTAAIADLVKACVKVEAAALLRLDARRPLTPENVDEDRARRIGDMRWVVPCADGGIAAVLVEHQSKKVKRMTSRLLRYIADGLDSLLDAGEWTEGEPPPAFVVIVLYTARAPWRGLELLPASLPLLGTAGQGRPIWIWLLDMQRYAEEEVPEFNVIHALSRAERYPERFWDVVRELRERFRGPEGAEDRAALGPWLWDGGKAAKIHGIDRFTAATILEDENEEGAMEERYREYLEGLRAEGEADGEAKGEASVLGQVAARRFGEETAERLVAACGPGNGKRIGDVLDAIYASDTAADLLARVERL